MKRFASPLFAVLITGVSVLAQQKTVTIATVNNPDMIELKKLSPKFEEKNPDIKLNWVITEENTIRQRITTDVSTGSGQFTLFKSVCMKLRFLLSGAGCERWKIYQPTTTPRTSSNRSGMGSLIRESCMLCRFIVRVPC